MSEWYESQKKQSSNIRKLLQERIEKANPRLKLTAEETKRLNKLEGIADKLKRGENVQNRQLQTWLSEDKNAQIESEWQKQLERKIEIEQLRKEEQDLKIKFENVRKDLNCGMRFVNPYSPINQNGLGHSQSWRFKTQKKYRYYD